MFEYLKATKGEALGTAKHLVQGDKSAAQIAETLLRC